MPLAMFQLRPGFLIRYRVQPIGRPTHRPELVLEACRPDEGPSAELVLTLLDRDGQRVDRGRVELQRGYAGVLREVRRQLERHESWRSCDEFALGALPGVLRQDDLAAARG